MEELGLGVILQLLKFFKGTENSNRSNIIKHNYFNYFTFLVLVVIKLSNDDTDGDVHNNQVSYYNKRNEKYLEFRV